MKDATEGNFGFILRIDHLSLNAFFYLIPSPGGAVVIEIVISVHPIGRTVVLLQQTNQAFLLLIRQIEDLLIDGRTSHRIFRFEVGKRHHTQLIIRLPFHKAHDKVRVFETEHSIIEYPIFLLVRIFVSDGRMAEQRINFRAWRTSQQADTDLIHG